MGGSLEDNGSRDIQVLYYTGAIQRKRGTGSRRIQVLYCTTTKSRNRRSRPFFWGAGSWGPNLGLLTSGYSSHSGAGHPSTLPYYHPRPPGVVVQ